MSLQRAGNCMENRECGYLQVSHPKTQWGGQLSLFIFSLAEVDKILKTQTRSESSR